MRGRLNAARKALEYVKEGMVVGLGTGRTAELFVKLLGRSGRKVIGVPTSKRSERVARKVGLVVKELNEVERIDLAVDGADQVDKKLNLIKGYGGALFREKVVDYAAKKFLVAVDESKLREELGGWVPLEVAPFAVEQVRRELRRRGVESRVRRKGRRVFVTDNGNLIVDAYFEKVKKPEKVHEMLKGIPGVIETGLFFGKKWKVVVGSERGARVLG
ncbi:MAG: ribose-5-phosphate isomerase RpiA [Candidatus Micrarchaeia archaeon]